tara:strand:+ start:462 stop:1790 length:1329 start_codon:yes stop_codon:yes gene_type:complete
MKTITKTVKTFLVATIAITLVGSVSSCKKEGCTDSEANNYNDKAKDDDGSCAYDDESVTGTLSGDQTWGANSVYFLEGKVIVPSGVTLTIDAGAIIKGREGQETQASALVVAKGGKLIANGTAAKPIIFTSELDDIEIGELVGSNLTKVDNQLWGGIIICGNAPVSTENGDTEGNIEGLNPDDGFGKYGGTDAADNSGSLSYVSIRHGGISIGEGNEINGLTLGGVGTGTSISNIEVYATLDDGIECFGGTVNISNALVFYQGDDGIDLDQNYSGTISDFAVIHGDGIGTDEGLEIDGPEGSTNTDGMFTLSNGLCMSEGTADGSAGDFKSKAQGNITNVTFDYSSLGSKSVKIRSKYDDDCADKSDAMTNLKSGDLSFTNSTFSSVSVYDGDADDDGNSLCQDALDANQTEAESLMTSGSGATIDPASLFSWTAAGQKGEL